MASTQSAQVFSLVYTSRSTADFSPLDEERHKKALMGIAVPAKLKNQRLNVRGILLSTAGYFLQWLEGDEAAVRALMATIVRDPRHTDVDVVYTGMGAQVLSDWSMSLVTRADAGDSIVKQLKLLRGGVMPRARGSMPAAMVLSVIKPTVGPGSGRSRRRVALIGQSGIWPAALLEHLSRKFKVPIAHTRLVGNLGFERQGVVEYLDIDHPKHGRLRLLKFSGDVLSLAWMTGIEEKLTACVLFYSHNSDNAVDGFSAAVQEQLGSVNRFTPMLCLFGRTAAPLMNPVLDWFAVQGRQTSSERMSLADSDAVWHAMEVLLDKRVVSNFPTSDFFAESGSMPPASLPQPANKAGAVQSTAPKNSSGGGTNNKPDSKPDSLPTANLAAPTRLAMPAPLGPPSLATPAQRSVLAKPPFNPTAPAKPQPSAAPVGGVGVGPVASGSPPAVLAASGKRLFSELREVDGVLFAGAQCLRTGATAVQAGQTQPALVAQIEGAGMAESVFLRLLQIEAAIHQQLCLRLRLEESSEVTHLQTRCADSFSLSFTLPAPVSAVFMLQMAPGYANEALVRYSVLALLREPLDKIFESG